MSNTMTRKVSIRDVARELGVSITTVSFVLNGKAKEMRISPQVEKKVWDHCHRIGYLPRQLGRSLRPGKSHLIAMLVEDMTDTFFSAMIKRVEQKAFERGYTLIAASTHGDAERTRKLIGSFRERQIDAYLLAPPAGMEKDIRSLLEDGRPVVLFDCCYPDLPTINVVRDQSEGVRNAASRLMEKGCRHIAFITTDSTQIPVASGINGYRTALKEQALDEHLLRIHDGLNEEEMHAAIASFFEYNEQLDGAIFASRALYGCGLQVLAAFNGREGTGIRMAGLEESASPALLKPVAGTSSRSVSLIAEELARELFHQLDLEQPVPASKTFVLEAKLAERDYLTPVPKRSSPAEVFHLRTRHRLVREVYY